MKNNLKEKLVKDTNYSNKGKMENSSLYLSEKKKKM